MPSKRAAAVLKIARVEESARRAQPAQRAGRHRQGRARASRPRLAARAGRFRERDAPPLAELRGEAGGVKVYDDFAHHPPRCAPPSTACAAGRQRAHPGGLRAALQHHEARHHEGAAALVAGRGRRPSATAAAWGWNAEEALAPMGAQAVVCDSIDKLVDRVVNAARPGDNILCMSNGGFGGIHAKLLATLAARAERRAAGNCARHPQGWRWPCRRRFDAGALRLGATWSARTEDARAAHAQHRSQRWCARARLPTFLGVSRMVRHGALTPGTRIADLQVEHCAAASPAGFRVSGPVDRPGRACRLLEYMPVDLTERRGLQVAVRKAPRCPSTSAARLPDRRRSFLDAARQGAQRRAAPARRARHRPTCSWRGTRAARWRRSTVPTRRPIPADVRRWLQALGHALGQLHRGGVVHGAVSAERVRRLADGRVLLGLPESARWALAASLPKT